MSAVTDQLLPHVDTILTAAENELSKGSINISDVYSVLVTSLGDIIAIANTMKDATDEDFKEIAVHVANRLYKEIIAPIDIPAIPNWIEPQFDATVGYLITPVLSGIIDGLISLIKNHNLTHNGFKGK